MKANLLILTLLFLFASLVGCGCGSRIGEYVVPYSDTNFYVSPLSSQTMTFRASAGSIFEGYFTIRGGADEVEFWIEDPWGRVVHNAGLVYDRYEFHITCSHEGYYTAYFNNTFSLTVGKHVYLHYRVR